MDLKLAREVLHGPANATAQYTEENIIWIGNMGFEASPEHIIVRVDDFKSGFECPRCLGKDVRKLGGDIYTAIEVSVVDCDNCAGMGRYQKSSGIEVKCTNCDGSGKIKCPACDGKGGSLVTPKNTEGRPTTGIVVSVGESTKLYKLGDKVMFTAYSGHELDMAGQDQDGKPVEATIRILVERDVLSKVHGTAERKNFRKSMALHTNA